ncbi:MAG: hypothetical protein ACT4QE_05655 [Anaerolineales bacterium]
MKRFILLLLALTLVRSLLYRLVTPPWQGPDEPGHFEFIGFIAEMGRVPVDANDVLPEVTRRVTLSAREYWHKIFQHNWPDLDFALAQNPPGLAGPRQSGYQLPLYYQLLAPLYRLTAEQPVLVQYYAFSFISTLLAVGTVVLAVYAARLLFPNDGPLQIAIPTLVALWPQQSFISAVINNDNLATFVAAWTITGLFYLFRHGFRWPALVLIVSGCLAAPFVKRSAFFIIPLAVAALCLWALWRWGARRGWRMRSWHWAVLIALSLAGLALAPMIARWAAPWLVSLPLTVAQLIGGYLSALTNGPPLPTETLAALPARLLIALGNIWSQFGWGRPLLPMWNYQLVGVLVGVAVIGLLGLTVRALRGVGALTTAQHLTLLTCVLAVAFAFVQSVVVALLLPRFNPPGRYMMTVLIPMSVLLSVGIRQWIPARWQPVLPQAFLAALIVQDAISLSLTLKPFFYG